MALLAMHCQPSIRGQANALFNQGIVSLARSVIARLPCEPSPVHPLAAHLRVHIYRMSRPISPASSAATSAKEATQARISIAPISTLLPGLQSGA